MARETSESLAVSRQVENIVTLFYMKKITKLVDAVLWFLIALGIIGGGLSAYVICSFWAGSNGTEARVQPVRPVLDGGDRSNDRLSLDGQRPIEAGNSKQGIR
jgi:hypothetical protein